MKKPIVLEYIEYLTALFFLFMFRILPNRTGRFLGKVIGIISYYLFAGSRHTGLVNLDIVYGDTISEKEKRKILFKAFINMGITIFEFIQFPKFSKEYFNSRTKVFGYERVKKRIDEGNGVIVCSAHYSNWEWIAAYFGQQGVKVNAVIRALDNSLLDAYIERERKAKGITIMERKYAVRRGYKVLEWGEVLALMIDQNAAVGGVFVPYFGELASTMRGPSVYFKKTHSPVFFSWDLRDTKGNHEIHFSDEFSMGEDDYENLIQINSFIEGVVKENPELNFWVHPRWNKRPEGEESFYKKKRKL